MAPGFRVQGLQSLRHQAAVAASILATENRSHGFGHLNVTPASRLGANAQAGSSF
jgi:hypothetical protein